MEDHVEHLWTDGEEHVWIDGEEHDLWMEEHVKHVSKKGHMNHEVQMDPVRNEEKEHVMEHGKQEREQEYAKEHNSFDKLVMNTEQKEVANKVAVKFEV